MAVRPEATFLRLWQKCHKIGGMAHLDRLQELLRNASNMSAIARSAGCHLRTVYRVRDGQIRDPGTSLVDRLTVAARKFQKAERAEPVADGSEVR